MVNQQSILDSYRQKINRSLAGFFNKQKDHNNQKDLFFRQSLKKIEEYHLEKSSKRIRAILVVLGYQLFHGHQLSEIIKLASAMELIHSSLLIHDDIIDNDNYRRGALSIHYSFEKLHRNNFKTGDAKHFGVSQGILAGDIGFTFAYDVIINSRFPDRLKTRALQRFNQMYYDTCYGQTLDVVNVCRPEVGKKEVLEVYKYKTAKYTIETPLHLGAIMAGTGQKQMNIISKFAIPLGMAFQIQDDILGMFGNKKTIGKPVTSDLAEGKRTLLMVYAFKKANSKQRQVLMKYLGCKSLKIKDLQKVRKVIIEIGALKYCQDYAKILVGQAKRALKSLKGVNKNILFLLNYLADYIIKRSF